MRLKAERRLVAVIGLDVCGYSALMGRSDEDTHSRVGKHFAKIVKDIEAANGTPIGFAGDGLMAWFPSSVDALRCMLRIQAQAAKRNRTLAADRRIEYRIGINAGEVLFEQGRTGGDAVNIAARLEQLAEPGGITLSEAVFNQTRAIVQTEYLPGGVQKLKNIREPVTTWRIPAEACARWSRPARAAAPVLPPAAIPSFSQRDYRPSLAVLPFRSNQAGQADTYFCEGIIDEIINVLSGVKEMLVVSRSSSMAFAGAPLDPKRIGADLGVRYILHGSVRRAKATLRINVELLEAPQGNVITTGRFEGDASDLFDLQDRIALQTVSSIVPEMQGREAILAARKHPESMTAYDLTLQALDCLNRVTRPSLERARTLLDQAILLDPDYGLSYTHLSSLLMRRIGQGWSDDEAADRSAAQEAAKAAIARNPNDAKSLALVGHLQSYLLRQYDTAMTYFDRALTVGPSCPSAWAYSGLTCGYRGDYKAAVERGQQALRLSPLGPDACWWEHYLSQAFYLSGDFTQAVALARRSAAARPDNASNLRCLMASLVAEGKLAEAKSAAAHLLLLDPKFSLQAFAARTPLQGAVRDLFVQRLAMAGLPP